jgi:GNAT superfamily N-acetyltransferase
MEDIQYFLATEKDTALVLDMRMRFAEEYSGKQSEEHERISRASLTDYFNRELNKNYICWYATVNGEVASISGLVIRIGPGNTRNPSGIWGYIMNVYTKPEYRRKGLSAVILDKLLATASEHGIKAFELHATPQGEYVYIKNGFQIHNEPTYRKFLD